MFIFYSKLVPGHLSLVWFASIFIFVFTSWWFCVCVKKKLSGREKGKAKDKVSGQLFCIFSQAEEGQVWELYKASSLLIFPDSISASLTLPWRVCRGPKAFSKHQSVDAKQTNYYPPPPPPPSKLQKILPAQPYAEFDSASQDHYVHAGLLSAVAEKPKIGIKSCRTARMGNRIA